MCPKNGHNDKLSAFHWHMANRSKRERIKNSYSAWLDRSNFEPDTAYRIRLARIGNEVHFFFAPLARWKAQKGGFLATPLKEWKKGRGFKRAVHVWYKRPQRELAKALAWPRNAPAFRFFGRVRFTLRDIQVVGRLKEQHGS